MKAGDTPLQTLNLAHQQLPVQASLLLEHFDQLQQGQHFVLEHVQDPVDLYHHLLEERAGAFNWERLEAGPERWQVLISKPGQAERAPSIGELATSDYKKAEIFQRFGIKYCCAGHQSLQEACNEAGIQQNILEQFIQEAALYKEKEVYAFENWDADFLASYIQNTHHRYCWQNMPLLLDLAEKAVQEQAAFAALNERLRYFLTELSAHLREEEKTLFPLIHELAQCKKKHRRLVSGVHAELDVMLRKLEKEHELSGDVLALFRKLSHNYRLDSEAGQSSTLFFAKLMEFENDLVQHVHLENNLLFPKARALQKELAVSRAQIFLRQMQLLE